MRKIANIRKAVENGMPDEEWSFSRIRALTAKRDLLSEQVVITGEAPQINQKTALAYRTQSEKIMSVGSYAEKKRLIRSCVDKMTIAPDTLEVEINYKIPEAICALSGSGDVFCGYSRHACFLAGKEISAGEEWPTLKMIR